MVVNLRAAPGDLDSSFGSGGKVITNTGNNSTAFASVQQPDGKIVVVGGSGGDFVVIRYLLNGSLDTTFDNDGIVVTRLSAANDDAKAVALQPDGKIVVVGTMNDSADTDSKIVVVRYHPNGSIDNSFDNDGIATPSAHVSVKEYGETVALQSDGKVVIGGYGFYYHTLPGLGQQQNSVSRLNADGSLDTSFAGDGVISTTYLNGNNRLHGVAIQNDGKIVTSGSINSHAQFLTRYNPDGTLDSSFGVSGDVRTLDLRGEIKLVLQQDGKIVVTGEVNGSGGISFGIARFNANGSLDTTFGENGLRQVQITSFIDSITIDLITNIALQSNGKIVVVGSVGAGTIISRPYKIGIARLNANGSLDSGFGVGGTLVTSVSANSHTIANTVLIQCDGKIVVAGRSFSSSTSWDITLVRYEGDRLSNFQTAFDFDGDGKSDIAVFRPSDSIWYQMRSASGFTVDRFGVSTDKLVPADYDGDGRTDLAVYRPSNGEWSILRSSDNGLTILNFGLLADLPRPGDFDGDGEADIAVWRPSNGVWYRLNSSNNQYVAVQFGSNGDSPVIADFDGDGKSDFAVYRPSNGSWHWLNSSDNRFNYVQFGVTEDKPAVGDFDGDGRTDISVFRPSNGVWYRINSGSNQFYAVQFGSSGDIPTAGDFDGDGKADTAVFRPSNGAWYLLQSQNGFTAAGFGLAADKPVPSAYIP